MPYKSELETRQARSMNELFERLIVKSDECIMLEYDSILLRSRNAALAAKIEMMEDSIAKLTRERDALLAGKPLGGNS